MCLWLNYSFLFCRQKEFCHYFPGPFGEGAFAAEVENLDAFVRIIVGFVHLAEYGNGKVTTLGVGQDDRGGYVKRYVGAGADGAAADLCEIHQ